MIPGLRIGRLYLTWYDLWERSYGLEILWWDGRSRPMVLFSKWAD